jgi:hypothetical protein
MKIFEARYDGRCAGCGGHISAGEKIAWTRVDGKGVSYHLDCQPQNSNGNSQQSTAEEENPRYADYLAYLEYYKDEPDWF